MANLMESLYSKFLESTGVSTDTRSIQSGNMFFALTGPNFNGNKYALQAIGNGAKYAVVDDSSFADHPQTILVENTLQALQELANHHRKHFKGKVFALTGSNGKTTTKELLVRVLTKKYSTIGTKGNLNNHIGVPLTLLSIPAETEMAVIEMGANKVGDIAELCGIADPEYGLITNIGEAHTEGFGGIEGVIRGKSELFDHLRKAGGTPFINLQDRVLNNMIKRFENPEHYPADDVKLTSANPYIKFSMGGKEVITQLIGAYNFQNIAASVSVGRYFGVDDVSIASAISDYVSSNQRSQVIERGKLKIILDAYNANPTSMQAALESFNRLNGPKHVILGDMKELENSDQRHRQFGAELNGFDFDSVCLVGPEMKHASAVMSNSEWFENVDAVQKHLVSNPIPDGNLLIKGSRSMHMEKVLEVIQ
ncbi:MAG: UDP-N-acetylmuramoyl-tripeptide--D-alanyl-D-alanine ligase [Cyclobacteriaceae bacterium]|nr:UDP-N-acetylmuramoyl-tripeptide--D-alanyl-D-alanine ligase [Cyclobacteriaceae bacterium SS2]